MRYSKSNPSQRLVNNIQRNLDRGRSREQLRKALKVKANQTEKSERDKVVVLPVKE